MVGYKYGALILSQLSCFDQSIIVNTEHIDEYVLHNVSLRMWTTNLIHWCCWAWLFYAWEVRQTLFCLYFCHVSQHNNTLLRKNQGNDIGVLRWCRHDGDMTSTRQTLSWALEALQVAREPINLFQYLSFSSLLFLSLMLASLPHWDSFPLELRAVSPDESHRRRSCAAPTLLISS